MSEIASRWRWRPRHALWLPLPRLKEGPRKPVCRKLRLETQSPALCLTSGFCGNFEIPGLFFPTFSPVLSFSAWRM
jgi:hypothetical protein